MDEEQYKKRLKKINEDEKEGKITSEQAKAKRWKLEQDKMQAEEDEAAKSKKAASEDDEEKEDKDEDEDEDDDDEDDDNDDDDDDEDEDEDDDNDDDDEDDDETDEDKKDNKDKNDEEKEEQNDNTENNENSQDKDSSGEENANDSARERGNDAKDSTNTSSNSSNSPSGNSNDSGLPQKRKLSSNNPSGSNVEGLNPQSGATGGEASASIGSGAGTSAGAGVEAGASAGTSAGASAGAGAGSGAIAGFGIAILVIVIIICIIGIIFFFIGMPGLVVGKIGQAITNAKQAVENFFDGGGAAERMVDREDVANAAQYLYQMGYDLAGYGFLDDEVKGTVVMPTDNGFFETLKSWWYSNDTSNNEGLKYRYNLANSLNINGDNDITTGKGLQHVRDLVKDEDQNGEWDWHKVYLATATTGLGGSSNKEDFIKPNILMSVNSDNQVVYAKSKFLTMYLTAENATYMVRNYNTGVGNRILKLFGENTTANGSGMIRFYNASEIDANVYIAGIANGVKLANPEGAFGADKVSVSRSQRLLKIKNAGDGLFKSTYYTYNLDSYILRYGFPLQLSLSLHLSTMAPDFSYKVASRAAFDTMVNMALLETKNNTVQMKIKLDLNDDGIYETYTLETQTRMRKHKKANNEDEEGYDSIDEARDVASRLYDMNDDKECEDNETEEVTEDVALQRLEDELKAAASNEEDGKIKLGFYYSDFVNGNIEIKYNDYTHASVDDNRKIQGYYINEEEFSNQYLGKMAVFLQDYGYADYKYNSDGKEVGIVIKEELKNSQSVTKIKDMFMNYFKSANATEEFKEDTVSDDYEFLSMPSDLSSLRQANARNMSDWNDEYYEPEDGYGNPQKEWCVYTHVVWDNNNQSIVEPYTTDDGANIYVSIGSKKGVKVSIFYLKHDNRDLILFGDSSESLGFVSGNEELVAYVQVNEEEIWKYLFEGQDLTVDNVTDYTWVDYLVNGVSKHFPVRRYYRLIDENGNPVIFENENNSSDDFIYTTLIDGSVANTYYANTNNPEGWFWRYAIPKKFARAIVKASGLNGATTEEEISTVLRAQTNRDQIFKLFKSMESTNTDNFTRYLPFIASVTDHWYEDLDFSGCYEWVESDEDNPIVEVYAYESVSSDTDLVKKASEKGLLLMKETLSGKLKQIAEPHVSGVSGEFIRDLIDNYTYYIYDGKGKSKDEQKISFSDAAIDVIAMLEQINGESSQHIIRMFKELLASYNIVFEESTDTTLKKKLFSSIIETYSTDQNLYTEGDDCVYYAKSAIREGFEAGLNVLTPANTDNRTLGYKVVYVSDDTVCLEIIKPEAYYDGYTILISGFDVDRDNVKLNNELRPGVKLGTTKTEDIKLILRDADGAIVKNSYTMLSGTNFENFAKVFDEGSYKLNAGETLYFYESYENNIEGFKEGEKLVIPIDGTVTEVTENSITIKNTSGNAGAYTDYSVKISGIKITSTFSVGQSVTKGSALGETTTEDIMLELKDENGQTINEDQYQIADNGTYGYDTDISVSANAEQNCITIYEYLSNRGYDDNAIYGVLGNMYQESRWNPSSVQANQVGHGLIQWSYGRWDALQSYAAGKGVNWNNLELQLDYMIQENTWYQHKTSSKIYNSPYSDLKQFLHNSQGFSIEKCTEEFFECNESPEDSTLGARIQYAYKAKQIIEAHKAGENN